jgi:molecular chaperone DnaK (HSP70)
MIIGVDLGSLKSTLSFLNEKQFDILLNPIGQRETQNLVAFNQNQRLIGDQALMQQKLNLGNTFQYFTRFLGQMQYDQIFKEKIFLFSDVFWKKGILVEF